MKKILCLVLAFILVFSSCAKEHIHEFEDWATVRNPSCTESGLKERYCSCGEKQESEIPSEGHSSGDWITDIGNTCSEDGKRHKECKTCGEILEEESIPAGHVPGDWIIDKESTCTENGKRHNECISCGETITEEEIVSSGHKLVKDPAVSATCTKKGLTEGEHCSVCGKVTKKQESVPAKGHKWSGSSCSVCGSSLVLGIGETWVVEGQWEFTIDSVKAHYACNYLEDIDEGAGVVMIEYHYKNIGYVGNLQDLYFDALSIDVYDEKGYVGEMYPCTHKTYPKPCVNGTSCRAILGFVIPNESSRVTIVVNHIIPGGKSAQARFEVAVS